jgi:hypothetical protein
VRGMVQGSHPEPIASRGSDYYGEKVEGSINLRLADDAGTRFVASLAVAFLCAASVVGLWVGTPK